MTTETKHDPRFCAECGSDETENREPETAPTRCEDGELRCRECVRRWSWRLSEDEQSLYAALRPFAAFDVPQEMIRKGYRGTVYATQQIPGKPATELTVEDFARARAAVARARGDS